MPESKEQKQPIEKSLIAAIDQLFGKHPGHRSFSRQGRRMRRNLFSLNGWRFDRQSGLSLSSPSRV